mmetsp:Transcript_11342/g.21247  ORF Transcript_11342/g.21247 Transcript_11342/m.21247 type:complete len:257 (+) Transcript_11342:96-866(+)
MTVNFKESLASGSGIWCTDRHTGYSVSKITGVSNLVLGLSGTSHTQYGLANVLRTIGRSRIAPTIMIFMVGSFGFPFISASVSGFCFPGDSRFPGSFSFLAWPSSCSLRMASPSGAAISSALRPFPQPLFKNDGSSPACASSFCSSFASASTSTVISGLLSCWLSTSELFPLPHPCGTVVLVLSSNASGSSTTSSSLGSSSAAFPVPQPEGIERTFVIRPSVSSSCLSSLASSVGSAASISLLLLPHPRFGVLPSS